MQMSPQAPKHNIMLETSQPQYIVHHWVHLTIPQIPAWALLQKQTQTVQRFVHTPPYPLPTPPLSDIVSLDEPLLLALVDGLRKVGVGAYDCSIRVVPRLRPLGLIGVVGALVTEHVANQEHQCAEDGEDNHSNHTCTGEMDTSSMRRRYSAELVCGSYTPRVGVLNPGLSKG